MGNFPWSYPILFSYYMSQNCSESGRYRSTDFFLVKTKKHNALEGHFDIHDVRKGKYIVHSKNWDICTLCYLFKILYFSFPTHLNAFSIIFTSSVSSSTVCSSSSPGLDRIFWFNFLTSEVSVSYKSSKYTKINVINISLEIYVRKTKFIFVHWTVSFITFWSGTDLHTFKAHGNKQSNIMSVFGFKI